ncbi:MAG: BlaI/MecI/CopY family transcriptional regulator [Anaerovorax sp.]
MNDLKLPESEMKVMDILWEAGEISAREAAIKMGQIYGWKKNTTYTVLKNLQIKGAIQRSEPGFLCKPLVERAEVGMEEAKSVLDRFYKGSAATFMSAFLSDESLSESELAKLKDMINQIK